MRPWRCRLSIFSSSTRARSMARWSSRRNAGSSLGAAPTSLPSGARTCSRPRARASSASLQTSTEADSTSPMPARILSSAIVLDLLLPQPGGRLEALLDGGDEAGGVIPVNDAMVDGDREVHEVADHDGPVAH